MYGRFRLKDPRKAFDWLEVEPSFEWKPQYNIAPTQPVSVVTRAGRIQEMTWGIIPAWTGEKRPLINARAETVREKSSFKESFTRRRCLVPGDGFYEWTRIGKRPYLFTLHNDSPFALAGFWEGTEGLSRCCLLTTSANSVLEPIHDRMPVIVRREDWPEWLSPGELVAGSVQRIMTPYRAEEMISLAVSPLVNSARVDDARCCEPSESAPEVSPKLDVTRREFGKPDGQQDLFDQ